MKGSSVVSVLLSVAMVVAGSPASADVVTDWNTAALDAIRSSGTPPPIASRALAILHVSIYDAINGISRTYEPYAVSIATPASASEEAAASAAAHSVLVVLFPASTGEFDELHATTLAAIPDGPHKVHGVTWGESVAAQILALRAQDGSEQTVQPPNFNLNVPGLWQPTPPGFVPYLLPQWGFVAPFAMPKSDAFRPLGPPDLESARFLEDLNEVQAIGAASGSTRTPEQSLIALFWADGAGTETPPGHWNSIAQEIAGNTGNTIDDNARLFALLNIAMADAAICAWDAKYTFDFWRPVTAIRLLGSDQTWSSFIVTPPFPDYVSGHSTFSGAAATVIAMFYGTDDLPFETGSDFVPGVTREFASVSAAASEAAASRVYGGIHFRSASEDGLLAGIAIGEWAFTHYMRPVGKRGRR
jgi:membrane-associated phospholipid phosphatase